MRLFDGAITTSFVTIWNCVDEDGGKLTMPSIQSPALTATDRIPEG